MDPARDGVLNAAALAMGFERIPFMLNANWTTIWVILTTIWQSTPFIMILLLAGLQSLPEEPFEAALIDGASRWQSFRHVTLPLLMPTMFVVLVLSLIRAVQIFDHIFVLTAGGPGTATLYLVQYIYNTGFSNQVQRFGLASAASVVLGVTLLIFTLIQLRLSRSSDST